ncbi:MAG: D-alanine--D-alanine ligase [Alphaproteobacteria bacterium]|nr:D-alanine--D-alanine ligase [Alphaproteobacteria bacterium]
MTKKIERKNIVLLKGGWSTEREVSLTTAIGIEKALKNLGHDVKCIDLHRDMEQLVKALNPKPDLVFNALHGKWGEDGCIQAVLDMMAIPYTHSGRLSSKLAMNKHIAIQLFRNAGLPIAESYVTTIDDALSNPKMSPPYVIKPVSEGSSVGVHIVHENTKPNFDPKDWMLDPIVLVERYIPGRELSVAIMGDKALGILELRPKTGLFYNYEAKYTDGMTEHLMPAPIPKDIEDYAKEISLIAHKTLGCRGVTRSDIRFDDTKGKDGIILLEVNTQPGFTPLSIVPEIAQYNGISFESLIQWMVEEAKCDA